MAHSVPISGVQASTGVPSDLLLSFTPVHPRPRCPNLQLGPEGGPQRPRLDVERELWPDPLRMVHLVTSERGPVTFTKGSPKAWAAGRMSPGTGKSSKPAGRKATGRAKGK